MLDPLRVLGEHQGAARLLDRPLRRARADGRAGRAHPRPPRRDARRRRGGDARTIPRPARSASSTTRSPAARTCPTSRSSRARALGFAVSRAHHADVGGMEPGEPAGRLARARRGGRRDPADAARRRGRSTRSLANMRNPDERRGDLRAQLAAHRLAERRIDELCARRGRDAVAAAMDELLRVLGAHRARGDRAAPRRPLRGRRRPRAARRRAADPRAPSRSPATRSSSTSPARRRSTTATSTARSR